MCVLMVCGFLLAWVPYASFAAWIFFNRGAAFSATAMAIPAFFSKSSALFNPIIYILMNKQVSFFITAFTHRSASKLFYKKSQKILPTFYFSWNSISEVEDFSVKRLNNYHLLLIEKPIMKRAYVLQKEKKLCNR